MRHILLILVILVTTASFQANDTRTVEGDLYFVAVDFFRYFDASDSVLTKLEDSIKSVNKDTLDEHEKQMFELFGFMSEKRLLREPFIRLRQDDGKIALLFLNQPDYEKVKDKNRQDLVRQNKRIRIRAEVSEIKYDSLTVYEAIKLISVEELEGKTYWGK